MTNPNITSDGMSTTHLAWILNIAREWKREPMRSAVVQERMNAKFPASEHVAIWERLLVAIGIK